VQVDPETERDRNEPHAASAAVLDRSEGPQQRREQDEREDLRTDDIEARPQPGDRGEEQQDAQGRRHPDRLERIDDEPQHDQRQRRFEADQPHAAAVRPRLEHEELGEPLVVRPGPVASKRVRVA